MNENSDDFDEILKAFTMLDEFKEEPIEYRLHYDDLGEIIMTSMRTHPDSERYVVVDEYVFKNYYRYNIVNKIPQLKPQDCGLMVKLKKSHKGFKAVKDNAALLVEDDATTIQIEYYDYRAN